MQHCIPMNETTRGKDVAYFLSTFKQYIDTMKQLKYYFESDGTICAETIYTVRALRGKNEISYLDTESMHSLEV